MKDEYRQLLAAADEPGCYEFPSSFNYSSLEKAATIVWREIEDRLGELTKFEGAAHNQDASFSIAIILLRHQQATADVIIQPVVRFSNFGRLATVTFPELLGSELTSNLVRVIESAGFDFVPADVLDAPYDGVMAGNPDFPTWWVRYFDWI